MLNLTIDKLGKINVKLFYDVNGEPTCLKDIDHYYLFDFLEIGTENLKEIEGENQIVRAVELLKYWRNRIELIIEGESKFIPFELYDEYIGGFLLKRNGLEFKIKETYTRAIQGYNVSRSSLDRQIAEKKIEFETEEEEWLVNRSALISGINWSINAL